MSEARLRVAVACSPAPGEAIEVRVDVAAGATALDALRASGLLDRFSSLDVSSQTVGIWGRACALDAPVHDGDRVEIYRDLTLDPKEARRRRGRSTRGPR